MTDNETPEAAAVDATAFPRLWTKADLAAYYGCSERQVSRIVKQPGFPPPARGSATA